MATKAPSDSSRKRGAKAAARKPRNLAPRAKRSLKNGPECGHVYVHAGGHRTICRERGEHHCKPRAAHAIAFFLEICVHTKGDYARKPFVLEPWQAEEIVGQLFGQVRWDADRRRYIRRYLVAWIELARKNGKSELLAGIALYLLMADGEEGAEIYGCAKNRKQAKKVWEVAERMTSLSPTLARLKREGKIKINRAEKRIVYEPTGSYYEIISADAAGELGANPHGIVFDEVLAQPNRDLWDAMRTGMGTRAQPLLVAATTAGNDPTSFAAEEHAYCERVAKRPQIDPARFVYLRNTPKTADWRDEKTWYHANPGLGSFLSIGALRAEAREAMNNPAAENAFRQFRLNQWVQQRTRAIALHDWDASGGVIDEKQLLGRACFGGLDLSSTQDITGLAWTFPVQDWYETIWRLWIPEARVADLDKRTGGMGSVWVRDGWLTAVEGNVIDYNAVRSRILADRERFRIEELAYDKWQGQQLANELADEGFIVRPDPGTPGLLEHGQTFQHMSFPTKELIRLILQQRYRHGGNPVVRWLVDNLVLRMDPDGNVKPDKKHSGDKIDGIVAAIFGLSSALRPRESTEMTGELFR